MFGGKNYQNEVNEAAKSFDFAKNKYQLELQTNAGNIRLNMDTAVAPNHCKNLLGLAKIGFYDGVVFHRVVKDFVIQAGCPEGRGTGGPGYKVNQEFNPKKHKRGVLSMARTSDPNSAGSQFFICLKDVPFLDNQYTAFGETADEESLNVVAKIGGVETGAQDRPVEDVVIQKTQIVETPI